MWNTACANGQVSKTPQAWGDLARGAFPGFTGARPRMQLWHGTTDATLFFPNFGEEIKQWTNVLGVSQTPVSTDQPQSGWTHTRYGNTTDTPPVEAYRIEGVGHSLPMSGMAAQAIRFFGLSGGGGGTTTPPPTTTNPPPPPGGCKVTYTTNVWDTGLTAAITIANNGAATITGWSLVFTLPAGQAITSGWNATYAPASGQVTATNVSFDGTIPAGGSVSGMGFQATHTGNSASPTAFTLNGTPCAVG
jgi:hypothetical protein